MKFYVRDHNISLSDNYEYPCFVLVSNNWDDYSYKTSFELQYYYSRNSRKVVDYLKIMDIRNENIGGKTLLSSEFTSLDENYCSLGTSLEYYSALYRLSNEIDIFALLEALNDASYLTEIKEKFEETTAFKSSLLREREAKSALILGYSTLMGNPISSELKFSFSTTLKNADDEHKVDFDFNRKSDIPRRIFGIVGKNATGKTIFLSNLANALGYTKQRKNEVINKYETGVFDTELGPPFSKVICVSYSLFDNFKRPKPSKRFSYIYCGIRNEQDEIDRSELRKRHVESLKTINKKDRANFWIESLSSLVDLRTLGYKYDEEYAWNGIENISDFEKPNMLNLSSGQSMLLYALTEVIANITENSLILFDEPETHLHPNAIANLINVINAIAEKYNSFGIISTHSPLVVREIPSKNVYIFERDGNTPITRPLDIESYGENLTVITNHIFETTEVKEGYKKTLKKLSKSFKYEEILELFDNELSLNARIFLSGLYDDK